MDHFELLNGIGKGLVRKGDYLVTPTPSRLPLPCPTCGAAPLQIIGEVSRETGASAQDASMGHDLGPERFAILLACPASHRYCDPVAITGTRELDTELDPDPSEDFPGDDLWYSVRFIDPPYSMLDAHSHVPESIRMAGIAAGAILWVDAAGAANRIRAAGEIYLDELGVPTTTAGPKPKFKHFITRIDEAIDLYADETIKTLLNGVRILGNAGSHGAGSDVDLNTAIQGARILSLVLGLHYKDPDLESAREAAEQWVQNNSIHNPAPQ